MQGDRISFKELKKPLVEGGYFGLTQTEIITLIRDYGLPTTYGKNFTEVNSLDAALRLKSCKDLFLQHGEKWHNYFIESAWFRERPNPNGGVRKNYIISSWTPANFITDEYDWLTLSSTAKADLATLVNKKLPTITFQGEELEPIRKNPLDGGIINVWCKKCGKGGKVVDNDDDCPHSNDDKYYRLRVYNIQGTKKVILKSRHPNAAKVEAMNILNNLMNPSRGPVSKNDDIQYLQKGIELFLESKKHDPNNPYKKDLPLTPGHLYECGKHLQILTNILLDNDKKKVKWEDFEDEELVTLIYRELREAVIKPEDVKKQAIRGKKVGDLRFGPKSISKMLGTFSSLFIYMNKRYNLNLFNPFALTKRPKKSGNPQAMSPKDFNTLIQFMAELPELEGDDVDTTDLLWLRKAYLLERWFACRREDTTIVKWDNLYQLEGVWLIAMPNSKRTKLAQSHEMLYDYHYITEGQKAEMETWGWKVGEEEYLVRPEFESRKRMEEQMSKAFPVIGKACFGPKFALQHRALKKLAVTSGSKVHKQDSTARKAYNDGEMAALIKAQASKDAAAA